MTLVFGYGSLIESKSRLRTVPTANESWPIEISGLQRCWNAQTRSVGFSTTYLGIYEQQNSSANGVAFWANDAEVAALTRRESGYSKQEIFTSRVTWLAKKPDHIPQSILVFSIEKELKPSPSYPIIQSYVDICLTGCLAIDDHLGFDDFKFSKSFLRTTVGWSKFWVNDRIQPRAPFRFCPESFRIDQLLLSELPEEFDAIRIE